MILNNKLLEPQLLLCENVLNKTYLMESLIKLNEIKQIFPDFSHLQLTHTKTACMIFAIFKYYLYYDSFNTFFQLTLFLRQINFKRYMDTYHFPSDRK